MNQAISRAKFWRIEGSGDQAKRQGQAIDVDFNPVTLQRQISNTLDKGDGDKAVQYVKQSSAKLSMELLFDSTDDGTDVLEKTTKLADMMNPGDQQQGTHDKRTPPIVEFEWGTMLFRGMVESFDETLDYFSPEGVPLRATVKLGLVRQERVFTLKGKDGPAAAAPGQLATGQSASQAAADPSTARQLAAANGVDSVRAEATAGLEVGGGVALGGAVGFTGLGAGVSGSFGGGASLGASLGGAAGAGADAGFGAGLAAGTEIEFGGRATGGGASSLRAEVGQSASLSSRIRFGDG